MSSSASRLLVAWQNAGHGDLETHRAAAAALLDGAGEAAPELSRGMVIPGTVEQVLATFTGTVDLAPCSFTELDAVADAFACLDESVPAGHVRVKLWVTGSTGVPVAADGDADYAFEREWIVGGTFTATAELVDDWGADRLLVVVELTA